jgi:hypothetical protein
MSDYYVAKKKTKTFFFFFLFLILRSVQPHTHTYNTTFILFTLFSVLLVKCWCQFPLFTSHLLLFTMRETNLFANDTSNRSVGRKVVAQTQDALLSAFSRPDPTYFALVTLAVDCHRMRVFDTETGLLKCDYRSENGEKLTSLSWGEVIVGNTTTTSSGSNGKTTTVSKRISYG